MGKATLTRRAELPVLPSRPVCPAAVVVHGAVPANSGVVCGVIFNERQRELGIGMNPAQTQVAREGGTGDVFLTLKSDPSTIERMCCGEGMPAMHDGEYVGGRESYTYCPVFQAEKWRIAEGQERLGRVVAPESVEMDDGAYVEGDAKSPPGTTLAADDPWAQARRDLELFE